MPLPILPTTLVGSFPQPAWLIDREKLSKQVPRVNAKDRKSTRLNSSH